MPRSAVPTRTKPKQEVSHEIPSHNRPYTMPRGGDMSPRGTREELWAADFQKAVDHLKLLNDASAVEVMRQLPSRVLEMYLLAEEVGKARPMILMAFPKPGVVARERYLTSPVVEQTTHTDRARKR